MEKTLNNTKITFLNHASFIIEFNNIKLLNDPYLFGSAFNNGWNLLKEVNHENQLKDLNYIYISHEHPDHLSIPFLKSISKENQQKKIKIIFQKTFDKRVKKYCENLNFEFIEIDHLEKFQICENFNIQLGKVPFYDSWIHYEINEHSILNINDCVLENEKVIYEIKKQINKLDVLFTQFSYANYIPEEKQKYFAKKALEKIRIQDEVLKPMYIIPFASFIYFSHTENNNMNKNINTIEKTFEFLKLNCKAKPIILRPNETWSFQQKDNTVSLLYWENLYKNIQNLKLNDEKISFDFNELEFKSKNYIQRIYKNNNKFLIYILQLFGFFKKINIFLIDKKKFMTFCLINGLQIMEGKFKPKNNISLHSNSLAFIFDYDFGLDTLHVNSRFTTSPNYLSKVIRTLIIGSLNNTGRYIKLNNFFKFIDLDLIKRAIRIIK
jgi:UDP-MurNAc hydroxylase